MGHMLSRLTIVLCGRKIQALQVGKQKCSPLRVPSAIPDVHGRRVVDACPRWGEPSIGHDTGTC